MNKRIVLTHLGGFPLDQEALDFMQQSYRDALAAMANLCGDKVILQGVTVTGGNVSSGWIAVNGELIPFIGGAVGAQVVIAETAQSVSFEDGNVREVYFTKTATCGALGAFPFSDLVPLLTLKHVWLPGDLKQKYVDNAYIAANFDADGYGLNQERGWRILSKAVPNAAGRVFVNHNPSDTDFNQAGKVGGEKAHILTPVEQSKIKFKIKGDDGDNPGNIGAVRSIKGISISDEELDGTTDATADGWSADKVVNLVNNGNAHNVMNPYFVVLTLIKL